MRKLFQSAEFVAISAYAPVGDATGLKPDDMQRSAQMADQELTALGINSLKSKTLYYGEVRARPPAACSRARGPPRARAACRGRRVGLARGRAWARWTRGGRAFALVALSQWNRIVARGVGVPAQACFRPNKLPSNRLRLQH